MAELLTVKNPNTVPQKTVQDSGGSTGAPLRDPSSFNFMQFFGTIWQNRMLAPPGELAILDSSLQDESRTRLTAIVWEVLGCACFPEFL